MYEYDRPFDGRAHFDEKTHVTCPKCGSDKFTVRLSNDMSTCWAVCRSCDYQSQVVGGVQSAIECLVRAAIKLDC